MNVSSRRSNKRIEQKPLTRLCSCATRYAVVTLMTEKTSMPKGIIGRLVVAAGAFLILDAAFAVLLGKRYMLWGLSHTPEQYRVLIEEVSDMPPTALLGVKSSEGAVGLLLVWLGRRTLRRSLAQRQAPSK